MLITLIFVFFHVAVIFGNENDVIVCCKNQEMELFCQREQCGSKGYAEFANAILRERLATITPKKYGIAVKAIANRGLEVFAAFTSLDIQVEVSYVGPHSFIGINPYALRIKTRNLTKCAFSGLSNLQNLTIVGTENDINVHKDSFSGLLALTQLELRNISNVFTTKGVRKDNSVCDHYLCALSNMNLFRMEVSIPCSLTFGGIPSKSHIVPFTVNKYTSEEKEAICSITRHGCHNDRGNKCGLREVCYEEIRTALSSTSVILGSVIIAIVILAAIVVAVWVYHSRSTAAAASATPAKI